MIKNDFENASSDVQMFFAQLFDAIQTKNALALNDLFFNNDDALRSTQFKELFPEIFTSLKSLTSSEKTLEILQKLYRTNGIDTSFQAMIGDTIIDDFFKNRLKPLIYNDAVNLLVTIAEPLRINGKNCPQNYQRSIDFFVDYIGSFRPVTSLRIIELFESDRFVYDGSWDGSGGTYYTNIRKDILAGVDSRLPKVVRLKNDLRRKAEEKIERKEEKRWNSLSFKEKLYENRYRTVGIPVSHYDLKQKALFDEKVQELNLSPEDKITVHLLFLEKTCQQLEYQKTYQKESGRSDIDCLIPPYKEEKLKLLSQITSLIPQISDDHIIQTSIEVGIFSSKKGFIGHGALELSTLIIQDKGSKITENGFSSLVLKGPNSIRACFMPAIIEEHLKQNSILDTINYINDHVKKHDFDLLKKKGKCAPIISKMIDQCEPHISEKSVLSFCRTYMENSKQAKQFVEKSQHLQEKYTAQKNERLLEKMQKALNDIKRKLKALTP
ncbi:MAG: hypothetical protein COB76_06560 [Alphaproteobacteria bacterium]|nr:MAG: hypothetical protein COB76_06560 [Alphaproteobacteria bacterium]